MRTGSSFFASLLIRVCGWGQGCLPPTWKQVWESPDWQSCQKWSATGRVRGRPGRILLGKISGCCEAGLPDPLLQGLTPSVTPCLWFHRHCDCCKFFFRKCELRKAEFYGCACGSFPVLPGGQFCLGAHVRPASPLLQKWSKSMLIENIIQLCSFASELTLS